MESRYSKLSTRTIAIAAIVTCMALIASPSTIAETADPATADWLNDGENDEIELLTFFLFFVGYIGMGAAFVFFVMERNNVAPEFRTTMTISALIVGVAAFHYFYMRNVYIEHQTVSIEYRYMDWLVTVPLMALKFPSLVGKDAITDAKIPVIGGFANVCFFGAVWMIGWGYAGESGMVDGMLALILSGMGWAMIIVATGTPWTAGKGVDDTKVREELKWSLNALRTFIVVGWIIYPVGYLYSPEVAIMTPNEEMMAVAYNIADSINKIGFGVVAWMGAKKATEMMA